MLFPNITPKVAREGFCHTAEQDRLYALGYPILTMLVDGHKDDKKPADAVAKAFSDYFGRYQVAWPREVASRFVHAATAFDGDAWGEDAVLKAALCKEPVSADVARRAITRQIENTSRCSWYTTRHIVCVTEAVAGTDIVLEALVDALEKLDPKRWPNSLGEDGTPSFYAYMTGFLLLRSTKANAFRKRLEAIHDAASKKKDVGEGEQTIRGALDIALHGTVGTKRALANSHWQYWHWYLMADDLDLQKERLANSLKSEWNPEPRIVYLAGADLLDIYLTKKGLRIGKLLAPFLDDIGMFADARVFSCMVDMVGVKGAGEAPLRYFKATKKTSQPKLERLARGSGATAVKAQSILTGLK
jgi:hypothetical protein